MDTANNPSSAVPVVENVVPFGVGGTLTAHTGRGRFRFPWAITLLGVAATVGTAPTGAAIILDVNKNGTSVFPTTTKPTIAIGANVTTGGEAIPDTTAVAAGDYITVDIDQVGSTAAGADLTVMLRFSRP